MNRKTITRDGVLFPAGRLITPKRKNPTGNLGLLRRLANEISPNICIYRSLGGIGDVLMSTPAIRAIKHEWPGASVTYATDFKYSNGALKEILKHNPYVDSIIPYQIVAHESFDVVIDITSTCVKTEKMGGDIPNRIDLFAKAIGVGLERSGYLPVYIVTDEERSWACQKIKTFKKQTKRPAYIGIQARASTQRRAWPIQKVRQLVNLLANNPKIQIVVFDSTHGFGEREDWNMPGVEKLVNYDIPQVAAMIEKMDLIIAPDSGLMHLAGALNKKMVTIFGSTDPRSRVNHYPNTVVIRKPLACSPCWYEICKGNYTCLNSITVEDVFKEVMEFLPRPAQTLEVRSKDKKTAFKHSIQNAKPLLQLDTSKIDKCIVRDDGIGDLISCLPAFSAYRKKYPKDKIALATLARNREIMELSRCFDVIIPLEDKWDTVKGPKAINDARDLFEKNKIKDQLGCYHESVSRVDAMAKYLGVKKDDNYRFPRDIDGVRCMKEDMETYGINLKEDKIVTIQPNASCRARSWLPEYVPELIRYLWKKGYVPVILGAKQNPSYNLYGCINLTGQTSIRMMNATIAISSAFIGVDSGGIHLAAANNIPFVGIYNAIRPELRLCYYKNYQLVFPDDLECCPCWDKGCSEMECMKQATPLKVLEAFDKLMEDK